MHNYDRLQPQAPDIERAVIGSILFEPHTVLPKVIKAGSDLFFSTANLVVARAMEYLYEQGVPVDQLTVSQHLTETGMIDAAGGEATLSALLTEGASAASIDYHLKTLREKALLRKIILICHKAYNDAHQTGADPFSIADSLLGFIREAAAEYAGGKKTLTEEIREWVVTTKGDFLTTDVYKDFDLTTRDDKKTAAKILTRLANDGLIETTGNRRGQYRLIDASCERIDLAGPEEKALDLRWPFELETLVEGCPIITQGGWGSKTGKNSPPDRKRPLTLNPFPPYTAGKGRSAFRAPRFFPALIYGGRMSEGQEGDLLERGAPARY